VKTKNPLLKHITHMKRLKRDTLELRYQKALKMFAGYIAATEEWCSDTTMDKIYNTWCDICRVEND